MRIHSKTRWLASLVAIALLVSCKTAQKPKRVALPPPPLPPGLKYVPAPKRPRLVEQAVVPSVVPQPGFRITNITFLKGNGLIEWQEGAPPFQVQSSPTVNGPWANFGGPTTDRFKSFPFTIGDSFLRVVGSGQAPGSFGWFFSPLFSNPKVECPALTSDVLGNIHCAFSVGVSVSLVKLNTAGAVVWSEAHPEINCSPRQMVLDSSGNIFVVGTDGGYGLLVAKFSADGHTLLWKRVIFGGGGVVPIAGHGIVLIQGDPVIVGYFGADIDLGGGHSFTGSQGPLLVAKFSTVDGSCVYANAYQIGFNSTTKLSIATTHSDSFWIGATGNLAANFGGGTKGTNGAVNLFTAKFNADGGHLASFGRPANTASTILIIGNLSINANGDFCTTGLLRGSINLGGNPLNSKAGSLEDIFFARFSGTGGHLWSRTIAASDPHVTSGEGHCCSMDSDGNMLFGGLVFSPADFGNGLVPGGFGMFAAKYSPIGSLLWINRYTISNNGDMMASCVGSDNRRPVFGGWWLGATDFGNGPVVGNHSAFVLNLNP